MNFSPRLENKPLSLLSADDFFAAREAAVEQTTSQPIPTKFENNLKQSGLWNVSTHMNGPKNDKLKKTITKPNKEQLSLGVRMTDITRTNLIRNLVHNHPISIADLNKSSAENISVIQPAIDFSDEELKEDLNYNHPFSIIGSSKSLTENIALAQPTIDFPTEEFRDYLSSTQPGFYQNNRRRTELNTTWQDVNILSISDLEEKLTNNHL